MDVVACSKYFLTPKETKLDRKISIGKWEVVVLKVLRRKCNEMFKKCQILLSCSAG